VHDEEVVRKVLAEPVLAARAVALANSAVFCARGPEVTSARAAVMRLGYRNLYTLAAAMVVRQFGARIRDDRLRRQADQLWRHSAHTAALAYVVARKLTATDPDTALFAGIVHEAGGLYLLARADEIPGLLDDPAEWMGAAQEIISRELMKKMAIPEPVSQAIVALRGATLTPPPLGLRDTLLLAKRLAPVRSPFAAAEEGAVLASLIDEGARREAADEAASMTTALLV
jgi:HD-like signal output (HDOD) protein